MMERLTEKAEIGYREKDNDYSIKISIQKLGKLEDLEQELGIPLEVLFKALKEGIWFKNKNGKLRNVDKIHLNSLLFWMDKFAVDCLPEEEIEEGFNYIQLHFKDYGKTWALTREELENGR